MLASILAFCSAHALVLAPVAVAVLDALVEILHPSPQVNNLIGLVISVLSKPKAPAA